MTPDELTWITDAIAITNFASAHDRDLLGQHRAHAVLCLDRDLAGSSAKERGVECIRVVHLNDGPNEAFLFKEAVAALEFLTATYGRVVVHCRAGRSRSIAVVAAYLRKTRGIAAEAALELVGAKRPSAVAPELISLVEQTEP
jgi:protein-tyrosine phosphatase